MHYYVREIDGQRQIWRIGDDLAVLRGVSNPERGAGTFFKAVPGESIWEAIKRQASGWFGPNGENPFIRLTVEPGKYYPRMLRPMVSQMPHSFSPCVRIERNLIAISRSQLFNLTQRLDRICQTVHPSEDDTFDAYGHDVRNLLILTCTEVENHWRGILRQNGVVHDRYSTADYLQLRDAMRLDEYSLFFTECPWLDHFAPFRDWDVTGKPSQDLAWYDAYNAVKHDREHNFRRATLRHAFEALSAVVVLMVAQFGEIDGLRQRLMPLFEFDSTPAWSLAEAYSDPYWDDGPVEWTPIAYPF